MSLEKPAGHAEVVVDDLTKTYSSRRRGGVEAIAGVSLRADRGEFVSILGPSGCGKSTLLYIIGGFIEATTGAVRVRDEPVIAPARDRGIVFQEFALFPWLSVRRNVEYGLRGRSLSRGERREIVDSLLDRVKLAGMGDLYPKELSGGMKQRTAVARMLAAEPSVMLMDEPLGALDAQTRALFQADLQELWQKERRTVLFVTHSIDEAIYLSDRIYVFSHRPARVKAIFEVKIPRPRDRATIVESPRYGQLFSTIWDTLSEDETKTVEAGQD